VAIMGFESRRGGRDRGVVPWGDGLG